MDNYYVRISIKERAILQGINSHDVEDKFLAGFNKFLSKDGNGFTIIGETITDENNNVVFNNVKINVAGGGYDNDGNPIIFTTAGMKLTYLFE